jgi:metal-dependent hydrolase (beta-lactamase superfamily II)
VRQIGNAKKYSQKIIVVYGGKLCCINADDLDRTIDKIIQERGLEVSRVKAMHCVGMLASAEAPNE